MKKTLALLIGFALLGTSAISEQVFKVDPANFDGAKYMEREGITLEDFHAEFRDGEMHIVIHDPVTVSATPVFEASDTTKRDRLSILLAKMGRLEDLNNSELNEYLRLTAGL